MFGYVYILKSTKNNRFYVGSTTNVDKRITEHNLGKSKYTSESKPFVLVFSQEYIDISQARKIEYWIKKQKDKDFIKRIISEGKITKKLD